MTNHGDGSRGPSLFQARKTRQDHNHNHHSNHHNQHRHLHSLHSRQKQARQSLEEEEDTATHHIRSSSTPPSPSSQQEQEKEQLPLTPADAKFLHKRQVVVVQTVSVVQFIDATGAPLSVSTLRSDSVAPTLLNQPAGVTAGLSDLENSLPSVSLPSIDIISSDGTPSATSSIPTETLSSSSEPILSLSSETLTSAPSATTAPPFPIIPSGGFNSSSTIRLPSLFYNSTTSGIFANSTRTTSSSFRLSSTTFTSVSTSSDSSTRSTTSANNVATILVGGAGDGSNAGAGAQGPESPAQPTSTSGPGLTPEARNAVVGGVVGGVAGVAIAALLIMFFLKWRKRSFGNGIRLLGDGESTARGRGFASGPSGGGGIGGAASMAQRSVPFAVPAALAKLAGKRAIEASSVGEKPMEEKGFYRVSGKKLRSVLESGGDGYSDPDPRDSISGTSYYRDSQAFLDSSNLPPLQLGSPMRPVSGVPVFHSGPQRTPVQENGPFPAGHRPSAFPNMLQIPEVDALGRSLSAQDGSRISQSRFTEST